VSATAVEASIAMEARVAVGSIAATIRYASAIAITAAIDAWVPAMVEPRSGADEDASDEPVRAVVAVRHTRIWVVVVVTICTGRRRNITRSAYAHSDGNLRVRL
jgi:hypothetical protein